MRFLAPCAAHKMLCVNKMNKDLEELYPLRDSEFATRFLQNHGIEAKIDESFLNNIPETGPFITVSNHPFGGIDGIMI